MFEVLEQPIRLNAGHIVVKESCYGAPGGHKGIHGWRFKTGDQPNEVTEQDEQKKRAEKTHVPLTAVAHHILCLSPDKLVDQFEGLLELAGPVDGKPGSQEGEEEDENCRQPSSLVASTAA